MECFSIQNEDVTHYKRTLEEELLRDTLYLATADAT